MLNLYLGRTLRSIGNSPIYHRPSEIETGKSFASSELIEDLVSVLHVPVSYLFESPDDNPEESAVIEKAIDKIVLEMSDKMKDILSSR